MNFHHHDRVSAAFTRYCLSRGAQPTLREGRINQLRKSRVAVYARLLLHKMPKCALPSVDWDAVLFFATMLACFLSGVMVAGVIGLLRVPS